MSTVNAGGLTVPDDSDPVAQGAAAMRTMGSKLGAVAGGMANVSVSNAATGSLAVTFPAGRFTAAPAVSATAQSSNYFAVVWATPTATGFSVGVRQYTNTVATITVPVAWTAVQAP